MRAIEQLHCCRLGKSKVEQKPLPNYVPREQSRLLPLIQEEV